MAGDREKVIYAEGGGVAAITLNRPEARNALSPEMMDDLADALERSGNTGVRAVLITGSGGAFCAGADVRGFTQALEKGPAEISAHLEDQAGKLHRQVILKIRQLPKPVIAAVDGVAAGAGVGLALACDLRIASESARFVLAYSNIGATADGGSTYFLPRLVGPGRTMELYLLNEPVGAQRALELGLVNRVVAAEDLQEESKELARRLASGPTAAYGRAKALIDRLGPSKRLESQLDEETKAIAEITQTHDFQEGIRAFVEKRPPQFQGR